MELFLPYKALFGYILSKAEGMTTNLNSGIKFLTTYIREAWNKFQIRLCNLKCSDLNSHGLILHLCRTLMFTSEKDRKKKMQSLHYIFQNIVYMQTSLNTHQRFFKLAETAFKCRSEPWLTNRMDFFPSQTLFPTITMYLPSNFIQLIQFRLCHLLSNNELSP